MNDSHIITKNVTYAFCKYWRPQSDQEKYSKFITVISIASFGIIANIFVIVLALKYIVRKNLHYLIINMAVCDALFLISMLFTEIYARSDQRDIKVFEIQTLLVRMSIRASVTTLFVISIERFRATRRTLQMSRPYTIKQRVALLGICWSVPIIDAVYTIYIVFILYYNSYQIFNDHQKYRDVIQQIVEIVTVLCIVVFFTLNIITIRRISRPQPIQAHLNVRQQRKRIRRTRSATIMVLASLMLFACGWFPGYLVIISNMGYSVFKIRLLDIPACFDWVLFGYVTFKLLPILNSCFSPLMYIIFLADFRKATRKRLCGYLKRSRNHRRRISTEEMNLNQQQSGLEPGTSTTGASVILVRARKARFSEKIIPENYLQS